MAGNTITKHLGKGQFFLYIAFIFISIIVKKAEARQYYKLCWQVAYDDDYFGKAEADSFPVPFGTKQLFYVQRDPNINTIVYELNYNAVGKLVENDPIHIFWIRYTDGGIRRELNYIQRTFAYGIKSQLLGDERYKLLFVAYKKKPLYLMQSPKKGRYYVHTTLGNKLAILDRVYIKIDPGGAFWSPNVRYIEMIGRDAETDVKLVERITIK